MEIARKFNVADAVLLEFAGKEIEYLPADLDNFTDFDPDLNAEKQTQLKNVYLDALTFGSDKTEVSVVSQLTENLSAQLKNCTTIFKDVRYFVRKKFANSPAVQKELGIHTYRKARTVQSQMVLFMYELAAGVEKYKTELTAAGLKESVIASIKPAAVALEKVNVTQKTGKSGRSVKAEDRVVLLNNLYDILADFSEAAKRVFANDPVKRERYILPHAKTISNETQDTNNK